MSEVKKLRIRDEIPESDKWRIDKIYETPAKWNEELNKLKEEAPKLKDFEGKLGNKEDLNIQQSSQVILHTLFQKY